MEVGRWSKKTKFSPRGFLMTPWWVYKILAFSNLGTGSKILVSVYDHFHIFSGDGPRMKVGIFSADGDGDTGTQGFDLTYAQIPCGT